MSLTAAEIAPMRRAFAERFAALMADILRAGQASGEVESWIEPLVLARRMFAHYQLTMIEWARGEIDADGFRSTTWFGMCAMLLGVVRGRAPHRFADELRKVQTTLTSTRPTRGRARRGGSA
jgi:hypothetical protein